MKNCGESSRACMGGWCGLRDECERHTTDDRARAVERLCEPGMDGILEDAPIRFHRPPGAWEDSAPGASGIDAMSAMARALA